MNLKGGNMARHLVKLKDLHLCVLLLCLSFAISSANATPVDSIDLKEGIILHLDSKGAPIEIEILDASKFVSMDEFNILIPTEKRKEVAVHA